MTVDLTIDSDIPCVSCPSCDFLMDSKNPPILPKRRKQYDTIFDVPERIWYLEDNRPSCPECGVKFNVTIIYKNEKQH